MSDETKPTDPQLTPGTGDFFEDAADVLRVAPGCHILIAGVDGNAACFKSWQIRTREELEWLRRGFDYVYSHCDDLLKKNGE